MDSNYGGTVDNGPIKLGQIIRSLRWENNITETELSRGLCSRRMLQKIEEGRCEPDIRLIQMLISRLGKSPNKLEYIVSKKTCDLLNMQLEFEDCIDNNNEELAEELLKKYERALKPTSKADFSKVDIFFYLRNRACLYYYFKKDAIGASQSISSALDVSTPGWNTGLIGKMRLSTMEMESVLAYIYFCSFDDCRCEKTDIERLLLCVGEIIDKNVTDEEERANILPKYLWLLAKYAIERGCLTEAIYNAEKGLDILRKYRIMVFAVPLLELIVQYGEAEKLAEPYENYVAYKDALCTVAEEFGSQSIKWDNFFTKCDRTSYYPDWELFKEQRKARRFAREHMLDGIYKNEESLSRVETGKQAANKNTFARIMRKLGLEWQRSNFTLICSDFYILEKLQDLHMKILMGRVADAKDLLNELKQVTSLGYHRNSTLFEYLINEITIHENSVITQKEREKVLLEIIDKNKQLINRTYPGFIKNMNRIPLYDEAEGLSQLAFCLAEVGKKSEAVDLLIKTIQTYEGSYIDSRCNSRWYGIFLTNLGQYVKELCISEKAINHLLRCHSIDGLERVLCNIAIRKYRHNKSTGERSRRLRDALQIAMLVKDNDNITGIKNYIDSLTEG